MTKYFFTAIILTFLYINCHSQLRFKNPIDKFWFWFQNNENRLHDFQNHPDQTLNEILNNLTTIRQGLAVELEPPKDNVINMTISSNNERDLFHLVQDIVGKAPKIDGWKFTAFRQRMPKDIVKKMILKSPTHELNPDKMKFQPIVSGDTLDIIIYAENITKENSINVGHGAIALIENILGEYDAVTKVHSYKIENIPTNKEKLNSLLPLIDLADYVDKFYDK